MPDVSLLIQSGYTPRKEWIERHFRVELEEKKAGEEEDAPTQFDPQEDQDLFGSIFGGGTGEQPTSQQEQAANQDLEAAANVMDTPAGATPEESQADAMGQPTAEEELQGAIDEAPEGAPEMSLEDLLSEDEEEEDEDKPFGDQKISEDEAVEMTRK
jgi:hypothetical protein